MNYSHASCFNMRKKREKKAQIKIQQMAFVLVALMILFTIAGLFYFSIISKNLKGDVKGIREQEVIQTVRKMAGTPEFSWTATDCASCVDFDKALVLKERKSYKDFWRNINYLQIKRVYPSYRDIECAKGIYPECDIVTIIDEKTNTITHSAFVSLCRYKAEKDFSVCELGKIIIGFETVQ